MMRIWGKGLCFIGVVSALSVSAQAEDLIDIYQLAKKNDPINNAGFFQNEAVKEIYQQALSSAAPLSWP